MMKFSGSRTMRVSAIGIWYFFEIYLKRWSLTRTLEDLSSSFALDIFLEYYYLFNYLAYDNTNKAHMIYKTS